MPTIMSNIVSGHAPGHLRDQFCELIESGEHGTPALQRLAGRLWNCTDTLPSDYCLCLALPGGTTYAQAARRLRS